MRMRDFLLNLIYMEMKAKDNIFFLTADFGSPVIDKIKYDFPERYINVGIAEQNLVNVGTGLALEGFCVYLYAIAPFLSLRALEQIRINLSMLSQLRKLKVNLISVGGGISYDISGPTHQCLEDISVINTFPHMEIFIPSDNCTIARFFSYTLKHGIRYLRLDANLEIDCIERDFDIKDGFRIIKEGKSAAIITNGYFVKKILEFDRDILLIDLFDFHFNREKLKKVLSYYDRVITIEEGFVGNGIAHEIQKIVDNKINSFGLEKKYEFQIGNREEIYERYNLKLEKIIEGI